MKKELEVTNKTEEKYIKRDPDSIINTTEKFGDKRIDDIFRTYVKTGFEDLDKLLGGGFSPGWVVLGAISNLGKSTFALQMAKNIAKAGTPVLFFSLEMPKEWIAAKLISQQTYMDEKKRTNGSDKVMAKELVNKEEVSNLKKSGKWSPVERAIKTISKELSELHVIDAKDDAGNRYTAEEISRYVQYYIERNPRKPKPFVIIDYLQIIPMKEGRNASAEMFSIDHNIEILSKIDKDITVLLISSVSRASYKSHIMLDSFKGSGTIEYSADVVLALDFTKMYENNAVNDPDIIAKEKARTPRKVQLMALKQRYNASGKDAVVKFDYYPAYDVFVETEETSDKEDAENGEDRNKSQSSSAKNGDAESDNKDTINLFAGCTKEMEIEKLYKNLTKLYHPDNNPTGEDIMKKINEQYATAMKRFE